MYGLMSTMPELASLFASSWFDDPITFTDGADIAAIERLRCTVLGGRVGRPRQHLGEAQSIHAVTTLPSLRRRSC